MNTTTIKSTCGKFAALAAVAVQSAMAAAEKNAPYHDNCNFAQMIRTPVRMVYGTADDNCQTIGGIAAFNCIPTEDKRLRILVCAVAEDVLNITDVKAINCEIPLEIKTTYPGMKE